MPGSSLLARLQAQLVLTRIMLPDVQRKIETVLGMGITSTQRLTGGSISEAYSAHLADGQTVFIKTNPRANPRMFTCEAQGLAWLAEPRAITIPAVIAVSDETSPGPQFLVLEWIASAERTANFDEQLGEQLATLHASFPNTFGLGYDNFIATLEQNNTPHESWADFYVTCRLEPQLQQAVDTAAAPRTWTNSFASLFSRMEDLVGPPEPPARLHGDLWSGNLHTDTQGNPCLIDPAVYGGHREIDLAMLNLFGDPGPRFLATYNECYPLESGAEARVALYQLYPLLVHVILFGGHYVGSAEQALKQYL